MALDMKFLGLEFGGTELRFFEVDPVNWKLLGNLLPRKVRSRDITTDQELTELVKKSIAGYRKHAVYIGTTIAGNVDEESLKALEYPNSSIKGEVTVARTLRDEGYTITMTNDMGAAVTGEATFGSGKDFENILVATYSSGYNCAKAVNRKVVTKSEFGHTPYRPGSGVFCGCRGEGHLEPFLSGNGAASMVMQYFKITNDRRHHMLEFALNDMNAQGKSTHTVEELLKDQDLWWQVVGSITAKHVYIAYRQNPFENPQKRIHDTQVDAIAHSFGAMVSAHNLVEVIGCMGSQTNDWEFLFKPAIDQYQGNHGDYQLLSIPAPKIVRIIDTEIGVKGAVAYMMQKLGIKAA